MTTVYSVHRADKTVMKHT